VLVLVLVLLVTGASFVLVHALAARAQIAVREVEQSYRALEEAKQALIGYSVAQPEAEGSTHGPGYLPCPDVRKDAESDPPGASDTPCGARGVSQLGLFPWSSIGTNDIRDASGATIWYAVSGGHKINADDPPLNSEKPGLLSVGAATDVVAVLIAPGQALPDQSRGADPYDAAQYLEGDNQSIADNSLTTGGEGSNDVVLYLTRRELMAAVERRVARDIAQVLDDYFDTEGNYPWLTPFTSPPPETFESQACVMEGRLPVDELDVPGWLTANQWHHLAYVAYASAYAADPAPDPPCVDTGNSLTMLVQPAAQQNPVATPVRGVVVLAGQVLPFQVRPGGPPAYFEDENDQIATPNTTYVQGRFSAAFNDQVASLGTAP
jgi:hypothetical protein